jgi:hypothetical protein
LTGAVFTTYREKNATGTPPRFRPEGELLLRASLRTADIRNDIDELVVQQTFGGWRIEHISRAAVPSDTRLLDVLVVRLSTLSP